MITYNDYWLAHHGILNQKWGVRHGPPYPLGSDVSTGKRLISGGSGKPSVKKDSSITKANRAIKAAANSGLGFKVKTREYTIDEDIKAVNPKYNPDAQGEEWQKYCENCCYCVTAYEMRRRGYDVKAKPRDNESKYHELTDWYENPNEAMFDFKEKRTRSFGKGGNLDEQPLKKPLKKDDIGISLFLSESYINRLPNGSRGFINLGWYFGGGHIISFEKDKGSITVVDPQSNDKYTWDEWADGRFKDPYIDYIARIDITRVDDVDIIPDKIKGACK